jgi:hypothetical protein
MLPVMSEARNFFLSIMYRAGVPRSGVRPMKISKTIENVTHAHAFEGVSA